MNPNTGEIIGPAIQRIVAKRLGRAGFGLATISLLGLIEMAMGPEDFWVNLATVLGPLVAAASLLIIGTRTVRRAFGDPPAPWSPLVSMVGLLPLAFGFWLLALRGFKGFATGGSPSLDWVAYTAWTVLGYRLLRDSTRISEAGLLAQTMIVPTPEESLDVN